MEFASTLCLGILRPEKKMLAGTGSKNSSGCHVDGSAQLTALILAGCVSLKGRLHSFSLDDDVYRKFVSRARNKKRAEQSLSGGMMNIWSEAENTSGDDGHANHRLYRLRTKSAHSR